MNTIWPQFRDYYVGFNVHENKWVFAGRRFKRHGQALKAAYKEWSKSK